MQVAMQPPPYVSYGPGLPPLATPVPTMVTSVAPRHEAGFTQYQRKAMTVLSGLQIAVGTSCAIIYAVLISINRKSNSYYYKGYADEVGAGIWCGGLYILSGCLGVAAARLNRLSLMISSMIFSILSSLFIWVVIGFAAAAIDTAAWDRDRPCSFASYGYQYASCAIYDFSGYQTADSILIILSVIEFVISIWCSVLCCQGSCKACCLDCCYGSVYSYQPQMVCATVNSAGQHIIYVQQSGVAGGQAVNVLPNQPFYVDMQRPVNFAQPAAAAAAPPAGYYQPGVTWLPEHSAAPLRNDYVSGDADCDQRGEVTKDELAYGH